MKRLIFAMTVSVAVFGCQRNTQIPDKSKVSDDAMSSTLSTAAVALPTTPFAMAYVEVNSNNVSNAGCYTYGNPAQPLFTTATIFAANINADPNTGIPLLAFNTQVQTTLNSTQIATLHNEGVKVILSVLGNHENAGWSCFSSYALADTFAAQCAKAVQQYNLDGIDIDDEYSACSNTYNNSIAMAVTALRARLGTSKIISIVTYTNTQYFTSTYNGKKVGDIVDLVVEDSYFSTDYASRMQPYINAGVPKSKLVLGLHLDDYNDQVAVANYVKSNGLGGAMAYGVTDSSQAQLSSFSSTYFGAPAALSPSCLDNGSVAAISSGSTYQIVSTINNTSVLDVTGGSTTNGTYVELWSKNIPTSNNQLWVVSSLGGGYYSLRAANTTNSYLDVYGGGTANGTRVDIWPSTGSSNQKWLITSIGNPSNNAYSLSPANAPGTSLDDANSGTGNGNIIDIYSSNGTKAQIWKFVKQ